MVGLLEPIAFLGAPWQVIVVALIVVGLFAPHMLPKLGRLLGRSLRSQALRRLGLSGLATRPAPAQRTVTVEERAAAPVEILMPEPTASTIRSQSVQSQTVHSHNVKSLASASSRRRGPPAWLITTVALSAAAVIFWLLLHSR
jgi:Sec-independent protein translocase protein TatA